jgi:hypothetical protein
MLASAPLPYRQRQNAALQGGGTAERTAAWSARRPRRDLLSGSRVRAAGQTRWAFLGGVSLGDSAQGASAPQTAHRPQATPALAAPRPRWGKEPRHLRCPVRVQRRHATLRGASHDSGVHGQAASRQAFCNTAIRSLLQWRNRRSPRHRATGQGDTAGLARLHGVQPRIVGRPKTRPPSRHKPTGGSESCGRARCEKTCAGKPASHIPAAGRSSEEGYFWALHLARGRKSDGTRA